MHGQDPWPSDVQAYAPPLLNAYLYTNAKTRKVHLRSGRLHCQSRQWRSERAAALNQLTAYPEHRARPVHKLSGAIPAVARHEEPTSQSIGRARVESLVALWF